MLGRIAAFELRYQIGSTLFLATTGLLFLATFVDMAVIKLLSVGGGNVLFNSPHSIIVTHLLVSLVFLFVGAAFVADAVLRDDLTGFGPIIRATDVGKVNYLLGRFLGASAAGALVMAAATLGQWIGTLMPFARHEMLGPNQLAAFAYGYGLFALPNALIIAAVLFALATATRSTAGTFLGVIGLLSLYLVAQRLMEGQPHLLDLRVLVDPLGMSSYMAGARYFTASELNAGLVPVSELMVYSRLLWLGAAVVLLAFTCYRFQFSERGATRRQQRRRRPQVAAESAPAAVLASSGRRRLPELRFDRRTARAQLLARAAMEARLVFASPAFLLLLLVATAFALPPLLTTSGMFGVPLRPLTWVMVPVLEASFEPILIIIATYYGGELVWRERERRIHEILDATPLPAFALMLPKLLGLALVLVSTQLVGMAVGLFVQLLRGGVELAIGDYLLWYLLPGAVDAVLIAALAVFVQALSPSKHAGWGIMVLYLIGLLFGPSLGLEHPLLLFGSTPAVPLSDMVGAGIFATAAWWLRLFWASAAVLLLVAAQLLWPRGAPDRWRSRLRQLRVRWTRSIWLSTLVAAVLLLASGSWIVYNTLLANEFRTAKDDLRYLAEYERRYLRYAQQPQPTVRHVELDVAIFPEEVRADVRGRYELVNETALPLEEVHVRLMNRDLELVRLEVPAARLERDDRELGYWIYRFDAPMQPRERRAITFETRRQQVGFRASGTEIGLAPNGSDLDSLELAPRIGMSDAGMIDDPVARREHGLPERRPLPRLEDLEARWTLPGGDLSWTTADLTISTTADQLAIAPGRRVAERVENGRRIARFVSEVPIKNYFSIQSARYAVRRQTHGGVELAVYFHPGHPWNVDRMLTAMRVSLEAFSDAFGPYQFDQARIIETPAYRSGGQAFANTIPVSETAGFAMDLRDEETIDMVSLVTAHELAHQWWGHQVMGARMQGAGLLHETLAQYSALMVMQRLQGEDGIRRFLQFQLDRYLSGRRTQVLAEEPLASVEISQQHIAYGKGALAMYLLQQRLGEEVVHRALRRFVDRYRFTTPPYPRSLELLALLREEVEDPADQELITDLFERITLYDLQVQAPSTVQRADGRWEVTVPVVARKRYADGGGEEREAALREPIQIGLFTEDPGSAAFARGDVVHLAWQQVQSGSQVFRFVTEQRPTHAGVDPYQLYIDRNGADNVASVASP
jgi:ABC-2 type transport system permease protein